MCIIQAAYSSRALLEHPFPQNLSEQLLEHKCSNNYCSDFVQRLSKLAIIKTYQEIIAKGEYAAPVYCVMPSVSRFESLISDHE